MIDYQFNREERSIKFISLSKQPIVVRVIGIIKGTNIEDTYANKFTLPSQGSWFIPKANFTPYSSVNIYVNDEYKFTLSLPSFLTESDVSKPNIIGIGLNKTGTTSFRDSMEKCGFKPFNEHFGHQYLVQDVHNGNIYSTLSFLESPLYDLYEDLPFSLTGFYKELYEHRPQDYYVLTTRDSAEQWVDSAIKFYKADIRQINELKDNKFHIIKNVSTNKVKYTKNYLTLQMLNWGIYNDENLESKLKDVYNRHLDEAVNFFESKPNSNFMVVNVSQENELKRVAEKIGFKNVDNNFMWSNKGT